MMGRDMDTIGSDPAEIRDAVDGRHVCPFCGAVREQSDGVCPRCTMENSPATRQATKSRIGPWYVLQSRNPAAPGMKFETLLAFIHKGRVKARSIVRGPTTHQLWRFAAHVKGLSREFGICYSCCEAIATTASICPHCNRSQELPANPDSFLETAEASPARSERMNARETGAAPLVGEDIVLPPISSPPQLQPTESQAPNKDLARKGADGFLTAADLAAAFKLDFSEPKGRRHKKTPVAPIGMSRNPNQNGGYRRRRWGVKLVLFLLLAAATGAGAFQYRRDANFHSQVDHYYAVASVWTREKWAELQKSTAAKPQHARPATLPDIQIQVAPAEPPPAQAEQPTHPANGSKPNAWDKLYHQPASENPSSSAAQPGKVEVATPTPSPAPAKIDDASIKIQHAGTLDEVWTLYRAAIDAEAQGQYKTAVEKYEQIKEFTTDLWPRDLDLRLNQARKLAQ